MKSTARPFILTAVLLAGLPLAGTLQAAAAEKADDPDWYAKKATWVETLEAAREAFAEHIKRPDVTRPLTDFGRGDFTVTAWVRTRKGGTILAKAPAEGNWAREGKTLFIRDGRLTYDIGWVGTLGGKTNVADGKWHHVALVKDGKTLRLVVDGEVDKEGSLDGGPDVAEHVLKLGHTADNFPRGQAGLAGDLDQVCLFARALSPKDVRAAAETDNPAGIDGLAACWTFEDGLADTSGKGHDAFAKGSATPVKGKVGKAIHLDGRSAAVVSAEAGFARVWPLLARDFPNVESLFDGQSLTGWYRRNRAGHASGAAWEAAGHAIVGVQELPGSIGMLISRKAFGDADLRFQVRSDWPVDAGVHLRMNQFGGGYEVTLHARNDGDVGGVVCGGFFDHVHTKATQWKDAWKKDDWNDVRITIEGQPPVIRTFLGGKPMATFEAKGLDLDDPPPAEGPIALKITGPESSFNHRVYFRHLRVQPMR